MAGTPLAPLSATTYRASAGAVEHARLCRVTNLTRALEELVERGFSVVGLDANGESVLEDVPLTGPVVLVLGAEGKGLRKVVKNACTTLARLPMAGNVASLNASVAIAVAVYEAVRQRRSAASPSK
ncbi:MAG: RNA methyltransferase [Polyangiaceae bacterium]